MVRCSIRQARRFRTYSKVKGYFFHILRTTFCRKIATTSFYIIDNQIYMHFFNCVPARLDAHGLALELLIVYIFFLEQLNTVSYGVLAVKYMDILLSNKS